MPRRLTEMSKSVADALMVAFGMKYAGFECRVPGCLGVTPNEVRRWHWSKTRRVVAKCRRDVGLVLSQHDKPELPVMVTMTRCSVGVCDDDGAIGAMKSCRDAIAKWLGVDDSDPRVEWRVEQRKCKRADVGVVIRIEARQ